jgi:hypothetical protein
VELKERTQHKAHNIETQTVNVQSEHSKLVDDRKDFLEQVDKRVDKKLEDWRELNDVKSSLKRDDRTQYDQENSVKGSIHEKNNRTQDLKGISKMTSEKSNFSPSVHKTKEPKDNIFQQDENES